MCAQLSHIFLDIAGLVIDFGTRYPEYVRGRCGEYLASADHDGEAGADVLHLQASEADIVRANAAQVGLMEAELYAMTIPLGEACPALGRLMMHGVAVECDGRAFIFTAASGVGKSTHAFLWQKYLGADRVRVINGDKPILRFRDDGEILACGSPWSGKEHLDANVQLPLRGICLLRRLDGTPEDRPSIVKASREEALDFMMHQIFIPGSVAGQMATFRLLERLYDRVPFYHLATDMSREGVLVSTGCLLADE